MIFLEDRVDNLIQIEIFKLTYWSTSLNFLKILSIYLMCIADINNDFS